MKIIYLKIDKLFFKGDVLRIRNITIDDRGVYKCIAWNLIGSGAQWTLKLSVRCKNLLNNID